MAIVAGILEQAGVLELDEAEIEAGVAAGGAMAAALRAGRAHRRQPRQAAGLVAGRPLSSLIARFGFLAPVARRWKTQLNENSKATAVFEELPEATHNTVVGFEQPESLRDHLFVVFLKSELEHPRNALRAELMGDLARDRPHLAHVRGGER